MHRRWCQRECEFSSLKILNALKQNVYIFHEPVYHIPAVMALHDNLSTSLVFGIEMCGFLWWVWIQLIDDCCEGRTFAMWPRAGACWVKVQRSGRQCESGQITGFKRCGSHLSKGQRSGVARPPAGPDQPHRLWETEQIDNLNTVAHCCHNTLYTTKFD